jgi:hypothetical protein
VRSKALEPEDRVNNVQNDVFYSIVINEMAWDRLSNGSSLPFNQVINPETVVDLQVVEEAQGHMMHVPRISLHFKISAR